MIVEARYERAKIESLFLTGQLQELIPSDIFDLIKIWIYNGENDPYLVLSGNTRTIHETISILDSLETISILNSLEPSAPKVEAQPEPTQPEPEPEQEIENVETESFTGGPQYPEEASFSEEI
jgi:hypothetical protein